MICRQKPRDISKCYKTDDQEFIRFMTARGIFPLHMEDRHYYFLHNSTFRRYMQDYEDKYLRKEGKDAV